jgi:serine/threonine protein kinase
MPSDSVAGFLDRAQANRVLFPEQVEQLIRQPDIPHSDLSALCEYLLSRGVLTQFQSNAIRESRSEELTFAGYPLIDVIGPCPGGTSYKALHPSLRTPLVLRRLRADWFAPADSAAAYLERARTFGVLVHTNIVPLLDAGLAQDQVYLVIDYPSDAADLETLAREVGGAMPGFLAAEYSRVIASALRMVHDRGGVHGEIRPGNLLAGPVTLKKNADGSSRRRPAPNAVVRLTELGLVPLRPPVRQYLPERAVAAYLPPERLESGTPTPRGDIYSLGATLYFLLASRPPFEGESVEEILMAIRAMEPTPLAALRPDLPPELVALVGRMMDRHPDRRPQAAGDVESALQAFCRQAAAAPVATVAAPEPADVGTPPHELVATLVPDSAQGEDANPWDTGSQAFANAHAAAEPAPRKRTMSDAERKRSRMLFIFGAILHATAILLIIAWIAGAFKSTPEPDSGPTHNKKDNPTNPKKNTKKHSG